MKKILLLLIIAFNLSAAVWSIPTRVKDSEWLNKSDFGWMANNKSTMLSVTTRFDTEQVISKKEIERYVKLKMRNFNRDLKFVDDFEKDFSNSYLSFDIELFKYNDKLSIYYGFVHMKVSPSINIKTKINDYVYTIAVAGSDTQIKQTVKEQIDAQIEKFVEDTYYMQDFMKAKK